LAIMGVRKTNRGAALLAVLWLAAGLGAIALTIANTVRGETERSSTEADGLKAYYLAAGAIDRMLLYMERPGPVGPRVPRRPGGPQPAGSLNNRNQALLQNFTRVLVLDFPTGVAVGEIIPETSKLDVNKASPQDLLNLLLALGQDPARAEQTLAGIMDWRGSSRGGSFTEFDQYYLSLTPSFQARHASLQEIEELLLVRGVTPDLFYGSYARDAQGRLAPHAGLRDCLSVYGSAGSFDVNTVEQPVMQAIGIAPDVAAAIAALRRTGPIRNMGQLAPFRNGGRGMGRLTMQPVKIGESQAVTLRATAQLKLSNGQLSDVHRTVSELVMFLDPDSGLLKPGQPPYHVMRWYENAVALQ
jgi:general secretion pathway protein K